MLERGPFMVYEESFDRLISESMMAKNAAERAAHVSSGKLSASGLGNPLQWQILKTIGVPEEEFDPYVLRVFERGKKCEDWLINHLREQGVLVGEQVEIDYRGTVGYIDALVDTSKADFKIGVIPHEIKSVKKSKWDRIIGTRARPGIGADPQHKLQATLYALSQGTDYYAVHYIAADDLRTHAFVYRTKDTATEVEEIIDRYDEAISLRTVPKFEPRYTWQGNPQYAKYVDFMELSPEEIDNKLLSDYPEAYKKLKGI